MSEGTSIKVPTWALPFVVSALVGAISYGAAQANAQATQDEVERIEKIVESNEQLSQHNSTGVQLNAQAIRQISNSLAQQQEISKASDEKLAQLIQIMLSQKTN